MAKRVVAGLFDYDLPYMQKIDMDFGYNLVAWIVNGEFIRDNISIEFVFGGHDLVYDFIPSNEIWIDNDVPPSEQQYTLLHELYERGLMLQGADADSAHNKANEIEWLCRQKSLKTKQQMDEAIVLNKLVNKKENTNEES